MMENSWINTEKNKAHCLLDPSLKYLRTSWYTIKGKFNTFTSINLYQINEVNFTRSLPKCEVLVMTNSYYCQSFNIAEKM